VRRQAFLQKGQLFITDTTDTIQGHYRTENCTKQEAPPEDKRPTKAQVPRSPTHPYQIRRAFTHPSSGRTQAHATFCHRGTPRQARSAQAASAASRTRVSRKHARAAPARAPEEARRGHTIELRNA
jgi:hypothetical protein